MEYQTNYNQSTNSTVKIFGDNAAPSFIVVSIALSLWIIVANLFVLICFIKHRNSLVKSTFTMQILTLSFSDFLVGLSTVPIYVIGLTTAVSYELCVFKFVIFLSAQVVALCHIFGICLTRLFVVCQLTSRTKVSQKTRLIALYLVISWIVTLGLMAIPFGLWGKYRQELSICSLNEIFQDNYKVSTVYLVNFYTFPTVLTNVIYIGVLVKIRISSRKIIASNAPSSENGISTGSQLGQESCSEEPSKASSNIIHVQPLNKTTDSSIASNESPGIRATSFKYMRRSVSFKDNTQTKAMFVLRTISENQPSASKSDVTEGLAVAKPNNIGGDQNNQPSTGSRWQHQSSLHRSTVNSHKKALSTIGTYILHCLT